MPKKGLPHIQEAGRRGKTVQGGLGGERFGGGDLDKNSRGTCNLLRHAVEKCTHFREVSRGEYWMGKGE